MTPKIPVPHICGECGHAHTHYYTQEEWAALLAKESELRKKEGKATLSEDKTNA